MLNAKLRPICSPSTFSLCAGFGPVLMAMGANMPNRGGYETGFRGFMLVIGAFMITASLNFLLHKLRELDAKSPVLPPSPDSSSSP